MRVRLPNRRQHIIAQLAAGLTASVGLDAVGHPKEIFLSGAKAGSEMEAIISDTSVVISLALQHGLTAETLRHSIARTPVENGTGIQPASVIGLALDLIAEIEHPDTFRQAAD